MRVSTSQQYNQLLHDFQTTRQRQVDGWSKIATGERISQPSEAPGDAVQLSWISQESAQINHYLTAIHTLSSQLAQEDILLNNYNTSLQAIRDLILQANNPAIGQSGRSALAQELLQWKNNIINKLNAQDAEGNYLFSGFRSNTPPIQKTNDAYIFNDNANQRQVFISHSAHLAANDTAHQLCFAIADSKGGTFNLILALDSLHKAMISTDVNINQQLATSLVQIDQTMAQAGAVQTDLGARMKILDQYADSYKQAQMYFQQQAGKLNDLDYASAISKLSQDKIAIEAASKGMAEMSKLSLFSYL